MSQLNGSPPARGVIFDMDGTLVDSALDFAAMRREMGLPDGVPILEGLLELSQSQRVAAHKVLDRHEAEGVRKARMMPGAAELLADLRVHGLKLGLLTRNSTAVTRATMERVDLSLDVVVTRDDGPRKPDPAGVLSICEQWQIPPAEVVMIGDFRFDIEAGRRAGARTVLFTEGRDPAEFAWADEADLCVRSFVAERESLVAWCRGQCEG